MSSSALQVSKRSIIVTCKVAGFHKWPTPLASVAHLGDRHRHLFSFRVEFDVAHDERDVEFQLAQAAVRNAISLFPVGDLGFEFGGRSCETIAVEVGQALASAFAAPSAVEVWEDDEFGARVEFAGPP